MFKTEHNLYWDNLGIWLYWLYRAVLKVLAQQLNYNWHRLKNQNQQNTAMKIVSTNQLKPISIMSFIGALAFIVSFSAVAGNLKKVDTTSKEMAYEMILGPQEEFALANDALSPEEENLLIFPQEVYIYNQDNQLIQHATGSSEELQQNGQLQAIIANSSLLMEDGGDKYYVTRK
ncbi:hypothetical protein [Xanthovirga aplysinae]|uniref:hypothetical protein n=1 Tax=Xanthovirga aplysinae TaxID=2529853 RepID=UPI0012BC7DCC|nr:hypothetical protein [Xanthovirga aplysinae]MTI32659.1 hypothetical protein [Xanthovirga aplysinae]